MALVEQEKQEKTRKKQGSKSKNKTISCSTLDEAKQMVWQLIQQGLRFNEITKQGFYIQGIGFHRFPLSEISKIKKEKQGEFFHQKKKKSENTNVDKAKVFKMLSKGDDPDYIVIYTQLDPNFVKVTYNEWLYFKNQSPTLLAEILDIVRQKYVCNNWNDLKNIISKCIRFAHFLDKLHYNCSICHKPVYLGPDKSTDWLTDLLDGLKYLSKNNWHHECGCSGPPCKI